MEWAIQFDLRLGGHAYDNGLGGSKSLQCPLQCTPSSFVKSVRTTRHISHITCILTVTEEHQRSNATIWYSKQIEGSLQSPNNHILWAHRGRKACDA